MTWHSELRKGRRHLFVPIKDSNARKEHSASTISRWICTTIIVDSFATLRKSKSIPGTVKAHEVHAVATSLQLFNKVDLQAVMKARRWSSGGTFISSNSETSDRIRKTGPVVAAGEIMLTQRPLTAYARQAQSWLQERSC